MPRPRRPDVSRGFAFAFIVIAGLCGGCVTNGDFERVRPELVRDNMHDWVGRDAVAAVGGPASEFRTTDQERELRDRAYALIEPPYNRNRWDSVWREYGEAPEGRIEPAFDRTAYLARLHHTYRRSEVSAYAQIVTDARNDTERLPAFFASANRVIDMDRRRTQSLPHVSHLNDREHANVIARTRENTAIVAWVCRALRWRIASYRYALERLVIAVPSPSAAETDRAIGQLAAQVAQSCGGRGAVVSARG
jgi:hypothetical protein